MLVEQLFDGQHLGLCAFDDLFDAGIHLVQPPLKRYARVRAHRAEIHRRKAVARILHHAPAHDGVTGSMPKTLMLCSLSDTTPIIVFYYSTTSGWGNKKAVARRLKPALHRTEAGFGVLFQKKFYNF